MIKKLLLFAMMLLVATSSLAIEFNYHPRLFLTDEYAQHIIDARTANTWEWQWLYSKRNDTGDIDYHEDYIRSGTAPDYVYYYRPSYPVIPGVPLPHPIDFDNLLYTGGDGDNTWEHTHTDYTYQTCFVRALLYHIWPDEFPTYPGSIVDVLDWTMTHYDNEHPNLISTAGSPQSAFDESDCFPFDFDNVAELYFYWACIYDWISSPRAFGERETIPLEYEPDPNDPNMPSSCDWYNAEWEAFKPRFAAWLNFYQPFAEYYDVNGDTEYPVWSWYHNDPYMNGCAKGIWAQPLWGLATSGEVNFKDLVFINDGSARFDLLQYLWGHGQDELAVCKDGIYPEGNDYGSSTYRYLNIYIDALLSATNTDPVGLLEDVPYLENLLVGFLHQYYYDTLINGNHIGRTQHGHNTQSNQDNYYKSDELTALMVATKYPDSVYTSMFYTWIQSLQAIQDPSYNNVYDAFLSLLYLPIEDVEDTLPLENPVDLTYADSGQWTFNEDAAVSGNYVVTATSYGVQVWDMTTPSAPVFKDDFFTDVSFLSVAWEGNYIYATATSGNLYTLDATDVTDLTLVDTDSGLGESPDIKVLNGYAYTVGTKAGGLTESENYYCVKTTGTKTGTGVSTTTLEGWPWNDADCYPTLDAAITALTPGGQVCIDDGTYNDSGSIMHTVGSSKSGTEDDYTIIRARNPGEVTLHYSGASPSGATGFRLDGALYVEVRGLHIENSGSVGFYLINGTSYSKIRRCSVDSSRTGFLVSTNSDYILFEDCFIFGGPIRYAFQANTGAQHIVYRRCLVRWDYTNWSDPIACFASYGGTSALRYVSYQNCVAIDGTDYQGPLHQESGNYDGLKSFFTPNGSWDTVYDGCISMMMDGAAGFWFEGYSSTGTITNCIIWNHDPLSPDDTEDCTNPYYDLYEPKTLASGSGGLHNGQSGGWVIRNCTFGNNTYPAGSLRDPAHPDGAQLSFDDETQYETMYNSIIYNQTLADDGVTFAINRDLDGHDYNLYYGNTGDKNCDEDMGSHSLFVDPLTNGLGTGYTTCTDIEEGSLLATAGDDGGPIGAVVMYKVGVTGTLWGEEGWDETTNESLWPWPYEDNIKEKCASFSRAAGEAWSGDDPPAPAMDGTRGFCAEGRSLSDYILNGGGLPSKSAYPLPVPMDVQIWDLTDPADPTFVSTLGISGSAAKFIDVEDDIAAVTTSNTVYVIDVSDPATPVALDIQTLPVSVTSPKGVSIEGNTLAVACDAIGFMLYDISTPSNIQWQSTTSPAAGDWPEVGYTSKVKEVILDGTELFAICETSGVPAPPSGGAIAYDVTNLAAPALDYYDPFLDNYDSGSVTFYANFKKGVVTADKLYLAHWGHARSGVVVLDKTDVEYLGRTRAYDYARDITEEDGWVYAASGNSGIVIHQHSSENSLVYAAELQIDETWGVDVDGDYAYVASTSEGLVIVDVSVPALPVEKGSLDVGQGRGVVHESNVAYVAAFSQGIHLVDTTDEDNPVELDSYDPYSSTGPVHVVKLGDILISASRTYGVEFFNVNAPSDIQLLGAYNPSAEIYDVAVTADSIAFAVAGTEIIEIDFTDPTDPQLIYTFGANATGIEYQAPVSNAESGYLYITRGTIGVDVYKLSKDSISPVKVEFYNTLKTANSCFPGRNFDKHYIYVADNGGVVVLNFTPEALSKLYHAEYPGIVIWRSEYPTDRAPSMYWTYKSGDGIWFNQDHNDNGNIFVSCMGDNMLVDSGVYSDRDSVNYHEATIAHNTVLVHDPREIWGWGDTAFGETCDAVPEESYYCNTGGQRLGWEKRANPVTINGVELDWDDFDVVDENGQSNIPLHERANILYMEDTYPGYVYIRSDNTNSYMNPRWQTEELYNDYQLGQETNFYDPVGKVTFVEREVLFVNNLFVLYDRIGTPYPELDTYFVYHTIWEPIEQSSLSYLETADYYNYGGTNQTQCYISVLSPESIEAEVIGSNTDVDTWTYICDCLPWDSSHCEETDPIWGLPDCQSHNQSSNIMGGRWRLEYHFTSTTDTERHAVSVIQPGDAEAPREEVVEVVGSPLRYTVIIGTTVVSFAKDVPNSDSENFLYTTSDGIAVNHILANVKPSVEYDIYLDSVLQSSVWSTPSGVLSFGGNDDGDWLIAETSKMDGKDPAVATSFAELDIVKETYFPAHEGSFLADYLNSP